jgi:hypothetical protein
MSIENIKNYDLLNNNDRKYLKVVEVDFQMSMI